MSTREELEALFHQHGCDDFTWIVPQQISVAQWVRMKCMFGCSSYGHKASCPPQTPSVEECRAFMADYRTAALFHFTAIAPEREERERWLREINAGVMRVERATFLAGNQKAFAIPASTCRLCAECQPTRAECKHLDMARPTAEGLAIDVYSTARNAGYPIQVLTDLGQAMNRYAILLVE